MNRQEWEDTFAWTEKARDYIIDNASYPAKQTLFAYRYFDMHRRETGYWIVGVSDHIGAGVIFQHPRTWAPELLSVLIFNKPRYVT